MVLLSSWFINWNENFALVKSVHKQTQINKFTTTNLKAAIKYSRSCSYIIVSHRERTKERETQTIMYFLSCNGWTIYLTISPYYVQQTSAREKYIGFGCWIQNNRDENVCMEGQNFCYTQKFYRNCKLFSFSLTHSLAVVVLVYKFFKTACPTALFWQSLTRKPFSVYQRQEE